MRRATLLFLLSFLKAKGRILEDRCRENMLSEPKNNGHKNRPANRASEPALRGNVVSILLQYLQIPDNMIWECRSNVGTVVPLRKKAILAGTIVSQIGKNSGWCLSSLDVRFHYVVTYCTTSFWLNIAWQYSANIPCLYVYSVNIAGRYSVNVAWQNCAKSL